MTEHTQRFDEFAQLNYEWSLGGHNTPEQFAEHARWLEQQRTLGGLAAAGLEYGENSRDPDAAMAAVRFGAQAAKQIAQRRADQLEHQRAVQRIAERLGVDPTTGDPIHRQGLRERLAARIRRPSTRQEGTER
jgi:hypothetical protein